jgi:2-dehydro-3-deoxyphosphooctonate aldolase (KDO 8-P synthase)
MKVRPVPLGRHRLGGGQLFLMAGPCVIETPRHALRMARRLADLARRLDVPFIFKASFDKANRSSVRSFRGPGLERGLEVLADIKRQLGVPVVTDVHEIAQVEPAARVVDVIQIPAFLCRQTDLLLAAGRSGRIVNVKKGQFMAPLDMRGAVEKIASTGNRRVLLTERGCSFGYNNLVVDMRSLALMRSLGVPVVFDATHSVQRPAGLGDRSGGDSQFIPLLARAGVAAGVDGLFLEVHDHPEKALSDGPNSVRLTELPALLDRLLRIHQAAAAALAPRRARRSGAR